MGGMGGMGYMGEMGKKRISEKGGSKALERIRPKKADF